MPSGKKTIGRQNTEKDSWKSPGTTALHYAVFKENLPLVDKLLEAKASISAKNKFDETPLTFAVEKGKEQVLQLLLDKKADARLEDYPPLISAINRDYFGVVQRLIAAKIDLEQCSKTESPLTAATQKGQLDMVWALCQANANPNKRDPQDRTPLEIAINGDNLRNLRIAEILLEAKADPRSIKGDVSKRVADIKFTPLKRLLERHLEPKKTALPTAISKSDMGASSHTLSQAQITELTTALHQAIREEDFSQVSVLLEKKANVALYLPCKFKESDNNQYSWLSPSPYETSFKELQKKAEGGDIYGNAFHAATEVSDMRIVDALLQVPGQIAVSLTAPLRRVDSDTRQFGSLPNYSPVYLAAMQSNVSLIDKLVEKGIDINHVDATCQVEETPLIMAVRHGNNRVVQQLLDKKANANQANSQGTTPLMAAAERGDSVSVNRLIAKNARVDQLALGFKGMTTPLHMAIHNGHLNVVAALCDAKANLNLNKQFNPLHDAVWCFGQSINDFYQDKNDKNMGIIKILLKAKAKTFYEDITPKKEVSVISTLSKLPESPQKFAAMQLLKRHQRHQIAITALSGTHQRTGRNSLFPATRSSLFDRQVFRLLLRLGAPHAAENSKPDAKTTESPTPTPRH